MDSENKRKTVSNLDGLQTCLESCGTVFPLPIAGWIVGIDGFAYAPVKGRLANAREILDWTPPAHFGGLQMESAKKVEALKIDHVLLGKACKSSAGTVMFIPDSKPDEMWPVAFERFHLDEDSCKEVCRRCSSGVPDIRRILSENSIP